MRRRDLADEVQVDVEKVWSIAAAAYDVALPKLVKQRTGHGSTLAAAASADAEIVRFRPSRAAYAWSMEAAPTPSAATCACADLAFTSVCPGRGRSELDERA